MSGMLGAHAAATQVSQHLTRRGNPHRNMATLRSLPGCVIGPDGRGLTEPVGDGKHMTEGILYVNIDLSKVVLTKGFLDTIGHDSRSDLLWLCVDKQ
ncbi:hypothetical protein F4809DRAFT_631646 [Biscogniauxia mediterranea]|nr:hypothetical protein F4809DRAFT_631646 [Biscogniauxia mediterranea]